MGLLVAGCGSNDDSASAVEPQVTVTVHPSRLAGDFATDPAAAERAYDGVKIVTSGRVTKVERPLNGVELVVEDRVGCWMYGVWEDDEVAAVDVGDRITLRGTGATQNVTRVDLKDCVPSPAG